MTRSKETTKELIDDLESMLHGEYVAPAKDSFDLGTDALYGGVAGMVLPVEEFELAPGLTIARTYAHVIAPFLMAFAPPKRPNAPHDGPWLSLQGRGLDISTEVRLAPAQSPLGFDRLNTLWFVVALLRLRLGLPLQMTVLADRQLTRVASDIQRANVIPIELQLSRPSTAPLREVETVDLVWVKDHIAVADQLMREPAFNRAMLTLDHALSIESAGAGVVIAWAAIETLIKPGSRRITERVCRALAAYLYDAGPGRDRAFQEISKSYETRGGAAHAGRAPEIDEFHTAFRLARSSLLTAIEQGKIPNVEELLTKWRLGV